MGDVVVYISSTNHGTIKFELISIEHFPLHCSPDLRVLWVMEGTIEFKFFNGRSMNFSRGTIEVININEPVEIVGGKGNKVVFIHIPYSFCVSLREEIGYRVINIGSNSFFDKKCHGNLKTQQRVDVALDDKLKKLITCILDDTGQFISPCAEKITLEFIDCLLAHYDDLEHHLNEEETCNSQHVERFINIDSYMLRNRSKKITLKEIAALQYIAPQHLSSEFRRKLNQTFTKTLEYYRTQHAIYLLLETDIPIGHIAYESGFSDKKYFNRAIKCIFDLSPGNFRKRYRKNRQFKFELLNDGEEFDQLFDASRSNCLSITNDCCSLLYDFKKAKKGVFLKCENDYQVLLFSEIQKITFKFDEEKSIQWITGGKLLFHKEEHHNRVVYEVNCSIPRCVIPSGEWVIVHLEVRTTIVLIKK